MNRSTLKEVPPEDNNSKISGCASNPKHIVGVKDNAAAVKIPSTSSNATSGIVGIQAA